ncbi:MAG: Holliday junction branch migration protein RuvA [Coxiella sp. (in: Bacteria)]|nr:MAG: Holliday junction branch migration protein RuvA [Coxiella sp. (in: g-proteobacteria)]
MIGKLTGVLLEKQPPELLIDVNGVGYEVRATMNTFYHLPECGQQAALYTHLIIRDDAHTLFGFHNQRERSLFRALIKVNGVGPKLGLAILSGIEPDAFVHCIRQNDASSLVRIPGVGKKTAERLVIEMRDRVDGWEMTTATGQSTLINSTSDDAISALITLGYKQKEAERAIKNVYNSELTSETLIRDALRSMMV